SRDGCFDCSSGASGTWEGSGITVDSTAVIELSAVFVESGAERAGGAKRVALKRAAETTGSRIFWVSIVLLNGCPPAPGVFISRAIFSRPGTSGSIQSTSSPCSFILLHKVERLIPRLAAARVRLPAARSRARRILWASREGGSSEATAEGGS